MNKVTSKTFTAELISHGSWGVSRMGKHESTMDLYLSKDSLKGYIEWDIPALETNEVIGLWFERDPVLELIDYDGVSCLPKEAVEMLEAMGIVVSDDFK
jgi:hypothetical protein